MKALSVLVVLLEEHPAFAKDIHKHQDVYQTVLRILVYCLAYNNKPDVRLLACEIITTLAVLSSDD